MSKIRVAVLRGGPSSEYEVSLKTGGHVLSLLRKLEEKYEPIDIFISRDGEWHHGGLVHEPHHALRHADVVWNAMHGAYGEDGKVQQLLDSLQIPYTGSRAMAAALALNKDVSKKYYERHSLLTPKHEVLSLETLTESQLIHIFRNYLHPVVVKPTTSGSSIGLRIARDFYELRDAVVEAFEHSNKVLVEEFIRGKEATCSVLENARGERLYAFIPSGDAASKENALITSMAKRAHSVLGLRHFSSSDFVITPKGKIYILETDAVPVFHSESHMHRSLETTGWKPHHFAEHCIELALGKK
jgi:D-alanine-D-alanine ligase